jgi:trehalose 6-phosphate phosphatase
MIYLFSPQGMKTLKPICSHQTLFTFDFDGTLAKIVKDPKGAGLEELTAHLLQLLGKYAKVAIISGRSLADLKDKTAGLNATLIGNHGIESPLVKEEQLKQFRQECQQWKEVVIKKLGKKRGIDIEDKTYSLAIHYRKSKEKQLVRLQILRALDELAGQIRILRGKSVINVLPAKAPNKGQALANLIDKTKVNTVFYVGDDDTDEDVFSLDKKGLITTRVGKKSRSRAQFFLHKQNEVDLTLEKILALLPRDMRQ